MPEQISSYRLEGEIARGGMGIVYRGVHMVFQEVVAIKAIFPELMLNPDLRDRFLNEARIQRRLQHPNIVQIREFLVVEDRFYIVMEYIQGDTLAQRLRQLGRPMTLGEAGGIFQQTLEGLGFAHSQGVIHRDIKPSNIMLTSAGVAKLTDFGIARGTDTAKLTRTGTALGTAAYMSPEQIHGTMLDQRTDIYSLGIMLYEILTGRVPFGRPRDSDSDFPILTAHTTQAPPPPRQFVPSIPASVESVILKALAKKPEERFQSCQEFQEALGLSTAPTGEVKVTPPAQPPVIASTPPRPVPAGGDAPVAASKPRPVPPSGRPSGEVRSNPLVVRTARRPETRPMWPWVLIVTLVILAAAGGAGWWFLGRREVYKIKQTLTGHTGEVTSVAFSPDGRLLASGSVDRTIKVWDVATRELKQTLTGHTNYVESITFSPDGHLLASGSKDRTVKIWSVSTDQLKQSLNGSGNSILTIAFNSDGSLLALGNWDGTIEIWDVAGWTLKQTLKGHAGPVSSVAFSPGKPLLASGSDDKSIIFWDVSTGKTLMTLNGHTDKVTCVNFSPDGHTLASGSADTTIRLWNAETGAVEKTLMGHEPWVRAVAFSPDGRLLASGSHDMTIKLWDVASGKEIQVLRGHEYDVESVAFSRDGRWIASGSGDRTVKLWQRMR